MHRRPLFAVLVLSNTYFVQRSVRKLRMSTVRTACLHSACVRAEDGRLICSASTRRSLVAPPYNRLPAAAAAAAAAAALVTTMIPDA